MSAQTRIPFHLSRTRTLIALAGLVALGTTAGCRPGAAPVPPAAGARTQVVLTNFKVAGLPDTASAGRLNLTVTNGGVGEHELLVFRSDLAPAQYPLDGSGNVVEDASTITRVSDAPNVAPGRSQERTVVLPGPGRYVFLCNRPGHFKAGMYKVVTVH